VKKIIVGLLFSASSFASLSQYVP